MQETSKLWKDILRAGGYVVEYQLTMVGETYDWTEMRDFSLETPLFGEFSAGNVTSASLRVTIRPKGEIPRAARIACVKRLVREEEVSERLPHGVYYIDTREALDNGLLEICAFDALQKTNTGWLAVTSLTEWPVTMQVAAEDIAAIIGVELDARTVLNPTYMTEYPNDYTMREVLGHIAAAHGGNWIMTYEGTLRLVGLFELPEETSLLVDDADGGAILFGDVRIIV